MDNVSQFQADMERFHNKVKLEKQNTQNEFKENGFILIKNFFESNDITYLLSKAKEIFQIQFNHFGFPNYFTSSQKMNDDLFKSNMIRLFKEQPEVFKNCGKLIQTGLIELYKLATHNKLLNRIELLELLQYPNMCTRPVLFFNHPELAASPEYYMTPKHQDWPSMQASQNSLVVWIPLVDVNKENGSIILYPGSHKQGVLPFKSVGGFGTVEYEGESIQPEMKVGDIAIFSTKLVHESGPILNDTIRWSCHFRYTDMLEQDFIERGYPNPYVYKPVTKQ